MVELINAYNDFIKQQSQGKFGSIIKTGPKKKANRKELSEIIPYFSDD